MGIKITELTYEDILELLVEDAKCTNCPTCRIDTLQEDDGSKITCSEARHRLFEELTEKHGGWISEDNKNKIKKCLEGHEQKTSSQESSTEHSSNEPFYEPTRNFMKKSGYKK